MKTMLEEKLNSSEFYKKGYAILPAENLDVLVDIRNKVFDKAKTITPGYKGEGPEEFFNKFHQYKITGTVLNEKRLALYKYISENLNCGTLILEAYRQTLLELIGPDILVQKGTNLVIQQPGDSDQSPTHRDAPLNSNFEVVVWVPLVDTYGTKGMFVLDKEQTREALKILAKSENSYDEYQEYARKNGIKIEVPFGHTLFFWPGLVHGVHVNAEQETRWSLNIRYKNLFSPAGPKGIVEFFDLLEISPNTRIALEFERGAGAV